MILPMIINFLRTFSEEPDFVTQTMFIGICLHLYIIVNFKFESSSFGVSSVGNQVIWTPAAETEGETARPFNSF